MHPEICSIGPFAVYSYGVSLVVAFWLCSWLLRRLSPKSGIAPEKITNLLFTVFFCGIAGGRLVYILLNFKLYLSEPLEIIMLQHGGLAWFGGFSGGIIGGLIYCRRHKLPLASILDLLAPFIALGHAIGRLGCFFNGCCYGKVSEQGFYFPVHGENLVPVQLYSSFLLVLIYVILRLLQDRAHRPGEIFLSYLLLYSGKRFFIEFWRGDSSAVLLGLTIFQVFSVVMFITALVLMAAQRKKKSGRSAGGRI